MKKTTIIQAAILIAFFALVAFLASFHAGNAWYIVSTK